VAMDYSVNEIVMIVSCEAFALLTGGHGGQYDHYRDLFEYIGQLNSG